MASRFVMTIDDDAAHPASSDSEIDTDNEPSDAKSNTAPKASKKVKRKKTSTVSEDRLDMDFDFAADDMYVHLHAAQQLALLSYRSRVVNHFPNTTSVDQSHFRVYVTYKDRESNTGFQT